MITNFKGKLILTALTASSLFVAGCTSVTPSTKNVKASTQESAGSTIPYEKYELDNGLTIVLHEDMSDPLVEVNVTYHVGSAREELGRSGFAHFFEHMMFQG